MRPRSFVYSHCLLNPSTGEVRVVYRHVDSFEEGDTYPPLSPSEREKFPILAVKVVSGTQGEHWTVKIFSGSYSRWLSDLRTTQVVNNPPPEWLALADEAIEKALFFFSTRRNDY